MVKNGDYITDSNRWQALITRNKQADGCFFYGVITTFIYCRPSCASRKPNRDNVRFFSHAVIAEKNGFRPCKRCQPQSPQEKNKQRVLVMKACYLIEQADTMLSLKQLAAKLAISPYYFHRLFKKTLGITPKQYAMAHRLDKLRYQLKQQKNISQAIYAAGYQSQARFYENDKKKLAMKALTYQKGGQGLLINYAVVSVYLGWLLVAKTKQGVCWLDIADDKSTLYPRLLKQFPKAILNKDCLNKDCLNKDCSNKARLNNDLALTMIVEKILAFLTIPEQALLLPLDIQGSAFQKRVWSALQKIPLGGTRSYKQIAEQIGQPKAVRAVASACAANTIALAIPCHRVLRQDGGMAGYRWGIKRKQALLKKEANKTAEN